MKKSLLLFVSVLLTTLKVGAQEPIDITFASRGDASKVDKVTVTNLTHPEVAAVTLNGTDILRLFDPNTSDAIKGIEESTAITQPILTPNPATTDGTLIFDAPMAGYVRISIYTTNGSQIETASLHVVKGRNTVLIPAQEPGIYLVNINGSGMKSTARWICGGTKSGSRITLGGAAQWSNFALPTKSTSASYWRELDTRAETRSNVVRMHYYEGDILRFEGKSGKMTTIMHLSPTNSFDCYFDFFRCQDKNGYNYPILRSGEMLWMLEDLRPQNLTGVLQTSDAAIWKNVTANSPAQFLANGKAYYNIQAAREALPEGWRMPSIDEVYAYVKELKANPSVLGDFLKDRDYK